MSVTCRSRARRSTSSGFEDVVAATNAGSLTAPFFSRARCAVCTDWAYPRIAQAVFYLAQRRGGKSGRDGLCPVRSHAARGDTRPPVRGVSGEGRASSRPRGGCRVSNVVCGGHIHAENGRDEACPSLCGLCVLCGKKTHRNGQVARSTTVRTRRSASPRFVCSPW